MDWKRIDSSGLATPRGARAGREGDARAIAVAGVVGVLCLGLLIFVTSV